MRVFVQPTAAVPGMYPEAWFNKLMTVQVISGKNDRTGTAWGGE
jgi:hypothetical protein